MMSNQIGSDGHSAVRRQVSRTGDCSYTNGKTIPKETRTIEMAVLKIIHR